MAGQHSQVGRVGDPGRELVDVRDKFIRRQPHWPLAGLSFTRAGFRNATRAAPADSGTGAGVVTAGPDSVVADGREAATGWVVYQQRRGVTGKPVRLADPPPLLAGREDLLAELDTLLTGGDDAAPRTVALCGLGGAGKTSVALAYAHRHLTELGVAWQFAADDATVLAAGFSELAAQLGARAPVDIQDPVASVHAVLARFATPWLLIFDDAADMASVAAFLPPAGPGRVLITSRNPACLGQPMNVPMLDRNVAAAFLVNRTGDRDGQAARDLADELGGLPLALEQAAAYIDATGSTLAGYLPLFQRRRAELLAGGEPTGYTKTVASIWALTFDHLQLTAPGAVGLLRLMTFYGPEAIPLPLLLQSRPGLAECLGEEVAPVLVPLLEDQLAAGDRVAALRAYSMVLPAASGSVSVHRLVQAVTEDQMPAELAEEWRLAAAVLIAAALPDNTASPASWPVFAALLPHAHAALTDNSAGMAQIANYLAFSGSYAAARDLQRQVLDARERNRGPEHPDTLAARHNLARWTGQAGDPAAARDMFAELLPLRERILGPEHRHTLANRHSLASSTGEAGDPAAARDLYAELLPVVEQVLGPEHRHTLTTKGNLARWTGQAGDPASARDMFAALLPVRERVLGSEHRHTLTTRGNIAGWTGQAGDPAAARNLYAELLPDVERVSGPEHPDTLTVRVNLASWTGEAGDPTAARDLCAELLPVVERVLGPEHRHTLTTRGNLARWTGQAGDPAAARNLYAELLPDVERVSGSEHPDTLTVRVNLASWTGEAGDPTVAWDLYAELLPVVERVSGPEHPDTLTTCGNLAGWTGEAGDPAAARDLYAELLPVVERVSGPEHPDTLTVRHNLASWTGQAGDPATARDLYAELLPVVARVLSPEHPHTLTTRRNLAYWTRNAKRGRTKG